jgi:hypothetical protein
MKLSSSESNIISLLWYKTVYTIKLGYIISMGPTGILFIKPGFVITGINFDQVKTSTLVLVMNCLVCDTIVF